MFQVSSEQLSLLSFNLNQTDKRELHNLASYQIIKQDISSFQQSCSVLQLLCYVHNAIASKPPCDSVVLLYKFYPITQNYTSLFFRVVESG